MIEIRECNFSYYLNYVICSACAYMLNNAGDMDEDDMAQNQKKFRFITETLIERYVLAVLVYE